VYVPACVGCHTADGVVEYIGESKIYGQYIKLRHAGGVTTFYAHCSKLCARKGQKVSMGDIIAKVGESGNATGPNLHFEIKLDGVFLNPLNYIDAL
jgi:murein DD-endopeptidase MepM/ murein hydrolase activator NlpD